MSRNTRRALSIVEVLVVVTIVVVLIGLLLPALSSARESAGQSTCASNLRQLGVAIANYRNIYDDHLPQRAIDNPFAPGQVISPLIFGGKRGLMPAFGVHEFGVETRPLNAFVDTAPNVEEELDVFHCPLDRGQPAGIVDGLEMPDMDSLYNFIGTSYALNDHTLDDVPCKTLVPAGSDNQPGGRMPRVEDPTRTWMIGDAIIYNYKGTRDRGQRWHRHDTTCNLCFVDGHIEQGIKIPESTIGDDGFIAQNTTQRYTFLPSQKWLGRCVP